ncbi:MAG: PilZ domain-containing protein [Candidatus Omnitrophota bacterium]|nr:PilZ domain-containing protein [Candidatus Omnitrophota bacterium]
MYLVYTVILIILMLVLTVTLLEELRHRNGITRGFLNKYWVLREKRKFVRFNEDMKIRYNRIGSESKEPDPKMENISRSGLCISTYEKLKERDTLELEVEVPGFNKPVKLKGRVVWIKELRSPDDHGRRIFYTGIEFGKINPDSEAILITYLNTLKRP